jgi:hypothetical protein
VRVGYPAKQEYFRSTATSGPRLPPPSPRSTLSYGPPETTARLFEVIDSLRDWDASTGHFDFEAFPQAQRGLLGDEPIGINSGFRTSPRTTASTGPGRPSTSSGLRPTTGSRRRRTAGPGSSHATASFIASAATRGFPTTTSTSASTTETCPPLNFGGGRSETLRAGTSTTPRFLLGRKAQPGRDRTRKPRGRKAGGGSWGRLARPEGFRRLRPSRRRGGARPRGSGLTGNLCLVSSVLMTQARRGKSWFRNFPEGNFSPVAALVDYKE